MADVVAVSNALASDAPVQSSLKRKSQYSSGRRSVRFNLPTVSGEAGSSSSTLRPRSSSAPPALPEGTATSSRKSANKSVGDKKKGVQWGENQIFTVEAVEETIRQSLGSRASGKPYQDGEVHEYD